MTAIIRSKTPHRLPAIILPKISAIIMDRVANCNVMPAHPIKKITAARGETALTMMWIKAIQIGKGRIILLHTSVDASVSFAENRDLSDVGSDIKSGKSLARNILYNVNAAVLIKTKKKTIARFMLTTRAIGCHPETSYIPVYIRRIERTSII